MTAPPSTETPRHTSSASDYADLVGELHQAAEEHDRGHGPLHAAAANAIDHLMTLIRLMQPGSVAQGRPDPFMDDYKRDILRGVREVTIEECAKIAEPWSGFSETDKMGAMDREVVKVRTEIAAAIRALSVVTPSPGPGEWQPIETAPRDGTRILATGGGIGGSTVEIVSYNERVGAWDAPNDTLDDRDDEPDGYNRPTLWQPLPACSVSSTNSGGAAK